VLRHPGAHLRVGNDRTTSACMTRKNGRTCRAMIATGTEHAERATDDALEDQKGDPSPGLESYPLDTLLIRSEPRAIADVLRRIDKQVIKLDPDFERDFVWDDLRQSRLVESVLLRIPLPVFYLAEDAQGKLIVVDGLQRLTTFKRFRAGMLKLKIPNSELDGKHFNDLSPKLQDRFEDGPLTFYLIDPQVPDRVRLDIFERVNSGVSLTRQQMRNALYNGPATLLLRELAKSTEFKATTGGGLSLDRHQKNMSDREAVNRFLAYYNLGWEQYGSDALGDFDEFLGTALRKLNREPEKLERSKKAFVRSMLRNQRIFGKHAFRKHEAPGARRSALNLALFDVFSVGLARHARLSPDLDEKIRRSFYSLLKRDEFLDAISYATARVQNVHTRFRLTEQMLDRVFRAQ
jgi:hypothetical protein